MSSLLPVAIPKSLHDPNESKLMMGRLWATTERYLDTAPLACISSR